MINEKNLLTARINAWLLMNQLHVSINQYEDREYGKIGISIPQFYILAAIKYLPSPVTITDIARWVDRKVNTVTLVLNQMEKKGLVKRERDLPDRRETRLSLTPVSEKIFEKATVPLREVPNDIFSCLSSDELDSLLSILQKLREKAYHVLRLKAELSELHDHRIDVMTRVLSEKSLSLNRMKKRK